MRRDEILRLLRDQPFRPFRLRLSSGITHEVHHPDMAIVTQSAIYIGVSSTSKTSEVADDIVVVALLHVVQADYLSPVTPSSAN